MSLLCFALVSPSQPDREEDLRAALLLGFVRFTEWPNAQPADAPITIGIWGQPELQNSMIRLASGKTVQGRPIQVRGIRHAADLKLCQVAYLGALQGSQLEELLSTSRDSSILTIGEGDRFLQSGGVIHLFTEDGRLSFEVHLGKLGSTKLNISSKLLRLGYTVKDQQGGRARP